MSKPFSIGFITTSLSTYGGIDRYSLEMAKAYVKHKDVSKLVVIALNNSANDDVGAEIWKEIIPGRFGFNTQWSVFRASMRHLRQVDVVHCTMERFGPGAALACLLLRKPLFLTLAGTYSVPPKEYSPKAFIKRQMMRFMYRNSAQILTMSERNTDLINEVMTVKNWTFTPNGVDISYFQMRDVNAPLEEMFIVTVGDVKPRKGADTTIQALGILKDKFPKLRYKIAGNTKSFPQFVEKLHKLIKENGLEDRVELLGRIEDSVLTHLYQNCVAFVLAARNDNGSIEGFPVTFYEAHACGAPVVSTYGFGSEYVVKNGYNGFLVNENDPVALAEAIGKIVEDDELRKEMVLNARKEAEKHTWDEVVEKYYIGTYRQYLPK